MEDWRIRGGASGAGGTGVQPVPSNGGEPSASGLPRPDGPTVRRGEGAGSKGRERAPRLSLIEAVDGDKAL